MSGLCLFVVYTLLASKISPYAIYNTRHCTIIIYIMILIVYYSIYFITAIIIIIIIVITFMTITPNQ